MEQEHERHAVVVGGGIGGLAAAIALHGSSWRVTVLERSDTFGEVGAGISLMPNGRRALAALGVGNQVGDAGWSGVPAGARNARGRWLTRTDGEAFEERLGRSTTIHRERLHAILRSALPAESLLAGTVVTGISPGDPGGAPAELTYLHDGRETSLDADLVVGADGLRSTVRGALWPEHPAPTYSGSTAWRAVVDPPSGWPPAVSLTWARGAEFGAQPLGDGRVYWYGAVNAPAGEHAPNELDAVRSHFGSWHEPIGALIDAASSSTVLRHDLYYLGTPLPSYVRGRVALLGDAAHAMPPFLGQGACQALEDAAVLGVCCAQTLDLARYDRERRGRTQDVVRRSVQAGRLGQQLANPLLVTLRNLAMRLTPASATMRTLEPIVGWHPPER